MRREGGWPSWPRRPQRLPQLERDKILLQEELRPQQEDLFSLMRTRSRGGSFPTSRREGTRGDLGITLGIHHHNLLLGLHLPQLLKDGLP